MSEQELREALERATAAIDDPTLFLEVHPMYRSGWLYAVDWIKSDLARDAHVETLDVETLRKAGYANGLDHAEWWWQHVAAEYARLRAEATPEGER